MRFLVMALILAAASALVPDAVAGPDSAGATFPGQNGKIAFVSDRDGNDEIYVMNADGSGQTRLTNNLAQDNRPDWSPDGSKIAFASDRDGITQIYVMNADGSGVTKLTTFPGTNWSPAWSPDGSRIAFTNIYGTAQVYVINADGSDQTRLTNSTSWDNQPNWSPDGSKIVFVTDRNGNREIYVMNADGSEQTRLTSNLAFNIDPDWSPDGSKIVFYSSRDGNREIYVMNADGSEQTRLTSNVVLDGWPGWSPDGSKIVFVSDRNGNQEIYVMNADGSGVTRLTNNTAENLMPDWQPFISELDATPTPADPPPTPTPTAVLTPAPDEPQPTPPASAVVLDFDTYPGGDWELASSGGSSYVSGGILTIDSPTFTNPYTPSGEPRLSFINAFSLRHPDGVWHQEVSNSRGWAVEARLRVAPSSNESCGNDLLIWMYDHDRLVKVGFGTNEVCFISPDIVRYPMDTTDGFHVYRVEVQLDNAKVYVDGDLVIDHILSQTGVGSSDVLMFGDGAGGDAMSLSYWDYFWYDVAPDMTPDEPQPTPTPVPTSAPTPDEPQATPAPVRGDANCDSITDAIDAALILQYVAGLFTSLPCPENADATLDGNINSVDALFVLQMVAGMFNECCAGLPDFPPDVLPQPTDTPVPTESRPERSNCHPSYHGVCLDPNALDYDCAGGTGNGPRWVEGPITVVGPDKFGLDRDGDGVGCE